MTPTPRVIDLYHQENFPDPDFAIAHRHGIRGVIHKATDGSTVVDSKYHQREGAARAAGMLWGAYHFLRPGDPVLQAQHFLENLGKWREEHTLMVLDHEDTEVRMWAALRFLQVVQHITNQTPWLYSGFLIREQQDGRHAPVFAEFPLWLAEYGPVAKVPQPWTKYVLWQYSDSAHIPGMLGKWDVSHFDGSDSELAAAWGTTLPEPPTVVAEATEEPAEEPAPMEAENVEAIRDGYSGL